MNQIVTAGAAQTLQAFVAAAGDRTELRSWNFCQLKSAIPTQAVPTSAIRDTRSRCRKIRARERATFTDHPDEPSFVRTPCSRPILTRAALELSNGGDRPPIGAIIEGC